MAPKVPPKEGRSKAGKKEVGKTKVEGKKPAPTPKPLIDDKPDPRVMIAALPPSDFDPFKASVTDLETYAYPRKPPQVNETAYAIWSQLVGGPVPMRLLSAPSLPSSPDRDSYRLVFSVQSNPGRDETSRNWSGLVATSLAEHPFTSVFGLWQVPDVAAPPGVSRGTFRCSSWVGLDGHNPTSASMPQIGTTQTVRVRNGIATKEFEAWSQWWARGATTPVQRFKTFPVDAGDVVACGMDVVHGTNVNLSIRNVTKNTPIFRRPMIPIIITYPPAPPKNVTPLSGTTAEWIVERPTRYDRARSLYRLPVFNTVTFTLATVQEGNLGQRGLGPVRVIRMVEPELGRVPAVKVLSRARKDYLPNGSEIAVAGPGLQRAMGG